MRTGIQIFLAVVLVFCLLVYVAGVMAAFVTNEARMLERFQEHSDTSPSGVDQDQYGKLAHSLTAYFNGAKDTPQVEVTRRGERSEAFSERELRHLQDVRGLVALSKLLRWVALGVVALLAVAYLLLRRHPAKPLRALDFARAVRTASGFAFVLFVVIALWGLMCFDGLFAVFHDVLFRNDLWQLDPKNDLLLQLMPTPFFVSYGVDLLKQNAFLLLILPLAAFGLRSAEERKGP